MSNENNFDEIKAKVEAILFSYGDLISATEIMHAINLDSELMINNALKELEEKYKEGFAFYVSCEDGKWKMSLKEKYEEVVQELVSGIEIPKPVLKVLSIIAYEQPVTKTRLAEILGKSAKEQVAYLYKTKFVKYEKRGIGKYYSVTKKFFDYFKLDEDEDFRAKANKTITNYLKEDETLKSEISVQEDLADSQLEEEFREEELNLKEIEEK